MLNCSCTSKIFPAEYRTTAEALFPGGGALKKETALAYAGLLGIDAVFKRVLEGPQKETERFLISFQNNLDLLIQKTWVEKADEARKEKLQDRIPGFIAGIIEGNYQKALGEFGAILEELAYLFFGAQSHKDDFTEYTFRIDIQIGLFWWYGGQIARLKSAAESQAPAPDAESLWAVLLLGICYLTNF